MTAILKGPSKYLGLLLILLLFLHVACDTTTAPSEIKVIGISDGDSFKAMRGQEEIRVRLEGIDCPEYGQAYSKQARTALSEMVFGKTVRLEDRGHDHYGRVLAFIYLEDGRCVNEEMIRLGMAWHFKRYNDDPHWARVEREARRAKSGLWADKNPVPPWEWRKEK